MSLTRADGSTVDVVDILLELVPAHKRHHLTKVMGEQGRPAVMVSTAAYDDTALRQSAVALESRVAALKQENAALKMTLEQVIAGYRQVEADLAALREMFMAHGHNAEIIQKVA